MADNAYEGQGLCLSLLGLAVNHSVWLAVCHDFKALRRSVFEVVGRVFFGEIRVGETVSRIPAYRRDTSFETKYLPSAGHTHLSLAHQE